MDDKQIIKAIALIDDSNKDEILSLLNDSTFFVEYIEVKYDDD